MEGTILVVDDDPNARSLLERLLGEQGHVVMTARDGAEAIALIPEIRPDLHERWDGKGYPNGLAGGAIPLGARIVSIADGFDAYTSDRPYRSAMSADEAWEILWAGAGTQWDPGLIELFEHIGRQNP